VAQKLSPNTSLGFQYINRVHYMLFKIIQSYIQSFFTLDTSTIKSRQGPLDGTWYNLNAVVLKNGVNWGELHGLSG
jgi:hypothetical protein